MRAGNKNRNWIADTGRHNGAQAVSAFGKVSVAAGRTAGGSATVQGAVCECVCKQGGSGDADDEGWFTLHVMQVRALFLTLLAVLLVWARHQQTLNFSGTAKNPFGRANASLPSAKDAFTLQFEVCNGFTNQRIALLSGACNDAQAPLVAEVCVLQMCFRPHYCCATLSRDSSCGSNQS